MLIIDKCFIRFLVDILAAPDRVNGQALVSLTNTFLPMRPVL